MRTRKVLAVMERGLEHPSAMVAGLQYKPLFDARPGYRVHFDSLIPSPPAVVRRGLHLGRLLRMGGASDAVENRLQKYHEDRLVEYAADCDLVYAIKIPSLSFLTRIKRLGRPKILTCFADGLWLPFFRQAGWHDLEEILAISDAVSCESRYMADFASRYNPRVYLVPDSPQVEAFDAWRSKVRRDPARTVLGWVGSPLTGTALYKIFEPLEKLFAKYPQLHLRVLGSDQNFVPRFEKVSWSALPCYDQQTMVREVLQMDIGLFPLFHNEESLARGTLKAMVYMSGEVAALCQNWGDCRDLVDDGVNGMLAESPQEWLEKLEWLVTHPEERREIARSGLDTVRNRFSREACFGKLLAAMEALV